MGNKQSAGVLGSERKVVRCAIYARKSTEEGLSQPFSSLDAQRESAEAYSEPAAYGLDGLGATLRRRRLHRSQYGASGAARADGGR